MGAFPKTRRARLLALLYAVALVAGLLAAFALAGPASGNGGTTGHHGQECPPGYHDNNGTCEHNGGGGGNCGDNQSGNNNGGGNNGNDGGFGHKGDCEATTSTTTTTPTTSTTTPTTSTTTPTTSTTTPTTSTTTPTTSTTTPTTSTTTPTTSTTTPTTSTTTPTTSTTHTSTTPTTTTGPFVPPVRCATRLTAGKRVFVVGRKSRLVVRVRGADGQPVSGVTVLVRGAGVTLVAKTNSAGVATFVIRARSAGVIRISVAQLAASCNALSRLVRAIGIFKPPKPNFTGR